MLYLVIGMVTGLLYWANVQWSFAPILNTLSPTYLHMLVIGWLTQLIFGVVFFVIHAYPRIHPALVRKEVR